MKPIKSLSFLAVLGVALAANGAMAADAPAAGEVPGTSTKVEAPSGAVPAASKTDVVLTKEEQEEKEARKACKADICAAFRNPSATGADIACSVKKSWRKEQLVKMVAKLKVTWPYGAVRCTSDLKLKRDELVKAATADKHASQIEKHAVSCVVDREKETASEIKLEFSPKVDFEKGKAVKAKMNWGKIEAPTLVKSAMWTATAADNTVNMLSSTLVEDINDFIANKCEEVKDDWQNRK